jgi:hypothetical protein
VKAGRKRARRGANLVGLDLARRPSGLRSPPRLAAQLLTAALLAALILAVLRIDVIRVQYGLADAIETEKALLAEQRELTVEMRQLRHPGRLAERARDLGFAPPERVIDLAPPPSPSPAPVGSGPAGGAASGARAGARP